MKHTQGPWSVEQCGENTIKVFKMHDKRRGRIATIKTKDSSWLELDNADALLIASAPEMFGALEAFVNERENEILALGYKSVEAYDKLVNHEEAYAVAKRAIAKAKGE